jgi:CelD/BcsL family acetyltransferase involved in cellulose biosynthesis
MVEKAATSRALPAGRPALADLSSVSEAGWMRLMDRALEPNAFYDPAWARAVSRHARGRTGAQVLTAYDAEGALIGLLPVVGARRALALPVPVLVAWHGYAPLTTPLLDRIAPEEAVRGLLQAARAAGAAALLLPHLPENGKSAEVFRRVLARGGSAPRVLDRSERAWLDATRESAGMLQEALGAKKLKELRRQRNRLADSGAVSFTIASDASSLAAALEDFLALEAKGWKGRRGTALVQDAGDAAFIREAAISLAAQGRF